MRTLVTSSFVVCLALNALAAEPEAVKIPLEEIWAYKMPGTKDLGKLDLVETPTGVKQHPIINAIFKSLKATKRPREDEKAGPGFVVQGTGKEALKKAAAILTGREDAKSEFDSDSDLTLVFYSYSSGRYVHITEVEKSDNQIKIAYRFVGHATQEMTNHFALVPFGKLSPGEVEVIIEQIPSINDRGEEKPPFEDLERLVCDSFTFEVVK